MFRLLIIITCTLIASWTTMAQDPVGIGGPAAREVHGQVRYAHGGPAENVTIRIERYGGGLVGEQLTDRGGKFRFAGLAHGLYNVVIHTAGYKDVERQVDLQTATSDYVLLQLVPDNSARPAAVSGGTVNASVPAEAQKEFDEGRAALDKQNTDESLRHLEKAIGIYPNYFQAQLLLGTAYMDAKQWDRAETALRRAQKLNPQVAAPLIALGEVYRQQKRYADAEKVLQEGLKLDDKSWQGHLTLGRVYWEMKDIVKAGPQVGRALQLKPDLAEGHLLAGNILLRARQPENALTEFEEYLRLAPKGEFSEQARATAQKIRNALAEKKR